MHKNHKNMSNTNMSDDGQNHYRHLLIMAMISLIAMYILLYAMVNTLDNVYNNFNQLYMAGLTAAPMVLLELLEMRSIYQDKKRNTLIIAGLVFFLLLRQQTAISDRQFLRSMIPHHSGTILMCEQASIQTSEIQTLRASIVESQQEEINQMETILQRLEQLVTQCSSQYRQVWKFVFVHALKALRTTALCS